MKRVSSFFIVTLFSLSTFANQSHEDAHSTSHGPIRDSFKVGEGLKWNSGDLAARVSNFKPVFRPGMFAPSYNSNNLPPSIQAAINTQELDQRIAELPSQSGGMCAAGVRESLNAAFNKEIGNGPNALEYNLETLNQWAPPCYKEETDTGGPYPDMTVKVLPPSSSSANPYGHIELFYKDTITSDFNQTASLASNTSEYGIPKLFVLSEDNTCSRGATAQLNFFLNQTKRNSWISYFTNFQKTINLFSKNIASFLTPIAHASANNKSISPDKITNSRKEFILAELVKDGSRWFLIKALINQGLKYELYRINPKNETELMAHDFISEYYLLESLKNVSAVPTKQLADLAINNWAKKIGEKNAQEAISRIREMTPTHKQSIIQAGFKLPEKFKLNALIEQ